MRDTREENGEVHHIFKFSLRFLTGINHIKGYFFALLLFCSFGISYLPLILTINAPVFHLHPKTLTLCCLCDKPDESKSILHANTEDRKLFLINTSVCCLSVVLEQRKCPDYKLDKLSTTDNVTLSVCHSSKTQQQQMFPLSLCQVRVSALTSHIFLDSK